MRREPTAGMGGALTALSKEWLLSTCDHNITVTYSDRNELLTQNADLVILGACPREGGESKGSRPRQSTVVLKQILRFARNDRLWREQRA